VFYSVLRVKVVLDFLIGRLVVWFGGSRLTLKRYVLIRIQDKYLLTTQVYWSESGELVSIACEDTFYVLRFSRENYIAAVQAGEVDDDGVESAFEVVTDINDT
jgi:hypothetical protein